MKTLVRIINGIAMVGIMFGGSCLDSNIVLSTAIILPCTAWLGLLIWVNK